MSAEAPTTSKPPVLLMLGLAGAGKTTLMQRLVSHIQQKQKQGEPSASTSAVYTINLDPAVANVPYPVNVDIRDTVNYKEVMDQFHLGPNGGILTALNLFTTRFGQVLDLVDAKSDRLDYVLVDTPGQIEIFTWSASGAIITESIASSYPTVVVYVIDTARCTSPTTFMSNMLYACSILYKTRLPFIIAFNKNDIVDHTFATEWMTDFESFHAAMRDRADTSYMSSLVQSMGLVLEEFYEQLRVVGCSALTGRGMDEFFDAVAEAVKEYESEYLPDVQARMRKRAQEQEAGKAESMAKLIKDLNLKGGDINAEAEAPAH